MVKVTSPRNLTSRIGLFIREKRYWLLIVSLFFGIESLLSDHLAYKREHRAANTELTKIFNDRSQQLLKYVQNSKDAGSIISKHPTVLDIVKNNLSAPHDSNTSDKLLNGLKDTFMRFQKKHNFKNFIIINPKGNIIYNFDAKETSLKVGDTINTEDPSSLSTSNSPSLNALKKSITRAQATLINDLSEFIFNPETNAPNLFLTIPIFEAGKNLGFLILLLDHTPIDLINSDIQNLGMTGETILVKAEGDSAILVAPTRKSKQDGFKTVILASDQRGIPSLLSSQGKSGTGTFKDHLDELSFVVYGYIPKYNLGLVVKKDIKEIYGDSQWLNFILDFNALVFNICLVLFTISVYGFCLNRAPPAKPPEDSQLSSGESPLWQPEAMKLFLQILTFLSGFIFFFNIINEINNRNKEIINTQEIMKKQLDINTEQLIKSLKSIETIGQSLVKDLKEKRLELTDIPKRLKIEVSENEKILGIAAAFQPYGFKKDVNLYAPYCFKKNLNTEDTLEQNMNPTIDIVDMGSYFDYTTSDEDLLPWYSETIEIPKSATSTTSGTWSKPYYDTISQTYVIAYSIPLYMPIENSTTQPLGVISVILPVLALKSLIPSHTTKYSKYSFILTKNGQFLSHPSDEFVLKKKTVMNLGQELEIQSLIDLGKDTEKGISGQISYIEKDTDVKTNIIFNYINDLNWSIGSVSESEKLQSYNIIINKNNIKNFIELITFLILSCLLLGKAYLLEVRRLQISGLLISVMLFLANLGLWTIVYNRPIPLGDSEIAITDSLSLKLFIEQQNLKSKLLYQEKLIPIETGLFLRGLDYNTLDKKLMLSGDFWQNLNKKHILSLMETNKIQNEKQLSDREIKDILLGFSLPQATKLDTRIIREELINKQSILNETISDNSRLWGVTAELDHSLDYRAFPFDSQRIKINIEPKDSTNDVLLVPQMNGYRFTAPSKRPGMAEDITILSFQPMKSYFTYNQNTPNVSFGIDNYPKAREKYTLNYEMLFKRDLIGALIVYALPLFILLMVVFSIILVLKKWLESTLSPQTALFFGLVYLHRDMRIRLISSDIIYMEYIFFTTYFMLLLATFYAVALYFSKTLRSSDNNINLIIISLFWPINFTLWLFSTLYVFF